MKGELEDKLTGILLEGKRKKLPCRMDHWDMKTEWDDGGRTETLSEG